MNPIKLALPVALCSLVCSIPGAAQALHWRQPAMLPTAAAGYVPVGTVLPYLGPLTSDVITQNWRLCDGKVVDDPESPFYGDTLPNLTERRALVGMSPGAPLPRAGLRVAAPGAESKEIPVQGVFYIIRIK